MFYFKACTKCRGDLILEKDAYGDYLKCMQCGKLIDVEVAVQGHRSLLPEARLKEAEVQALSRVQAKIAVAA